MPFGYKYAHKFYCVFSMVHGKITSEGGMDEYISKLPQPSLLTCSWVLTFVFHVEAGVLLTLLRRTCIRLGDLTCSRSH